MLSRVCAVAAAAALPSNSSANQILAVLCGFFFGVFKMQKQKWDKMSLCLFRGLPPSGMSYCSDIDNIDTNVNIDIDWY